MNVNNSNIFLINDQDIWDTWHLIFTEGTYKALFKGAQRKEVLAKDWGDKAGTERYIVPGSAQVKSRTLSIPCVIVSDTADAAWLNYHEFMEYIKNCGYFILDVIPRSFEFKLLYDDMPAMDDPELFSDESGLTILQFTLSLIDDFPGYNDTEFFLIDLGDGSYLADSDGEFIEYQ